MTSHIRIALCAAIHVTFTLSSSLYGVGDCPSVSWSRLYGQVSHQVRAHAPLALSLAVHFPAGVK